MVYRFLAFTILLASLDVYAGIPHPVKTIELPLEILKGKNIDRASAEQALEKEFWMLVQNKDFQGLTNWMQKAISYKESHRPLNNSRLLSLEAFASMMIARSQYILSAESIAKVGFAVILGRASHEENPNDLSNNIFNLTASAVLDYALGMGKADEKIEKLIRLEEKFGPAGKEGKAVAAMLLIYTTDKEAVQMGIDMLESEKLLIFLAGPSTPYKPMGMYLALAEGYVFLGDYDSAQENIDKALEYAKNVDYPKALLQDFKKVTDDLLNKEKGLGIRWKNTKAVGQIRMPLSPSMGADGCAFCHAGAWKK